MDSGYFRSREFAIAAAVAALVLLGGALALGSGSWGGGFASYAGDFRCEAPAGTGRLVNLSAAPGAGPRTRTLSYALDARDLEGGRLDACTGLGDVRVGASPDERVHLAFHLSAQRARDETPLDETDVRVRLREDGARVSLAAWTERQATYAIRPGSQSAVRVDLEILLPAGVRFDARASSGSGDVTARGVGAGDLRLASSFGDVVAEDADLAGDLAVSSGSGDVSVLRVRAGAVEMKSSFGDVVADALHLAGDLAAVSGSGRVDVRLASVQAGRLDARSNFGDVALHVPSRADVGYDVRAASNFGDVQVQIGPAETYETGRHETHVRSAGFADKPTQVHVEAKTGSGDARVIATEAGDA